MWFAAWLGCAETLPDDSPYVTRERLLAAAASPAEVAPGETVTLASLVLGPDGPVDEAPPAAFCLARRPLAELGPVAAECLTPGGDELLPFAGDPLAGAVPADACSRFGPNPPLPEAGEEPGRPSDPDPTGGYQQPALVYGDRDTVLAPVRIRCGLANVSQEDYVAWNQSYVSNVAPSFALTVDGEPAAGGPIAVGDEVELSVVWPACDQAPCPGAEPYVRWDDANDELLDEREGISATWYTTAGELREPRNGVAGDDQATTLGNTLALDRDDAWIAVVVRDDRGGSSWAVAWLARLP